MKRGTKLFLRFSSALSSAMLSSNSKDWFFVVRAVHEAAAHLQLGLKQRQTLGSSKKNPSFV